MYISEYYNTSGIHKDEDKRIIIFSGAGLSAESGISTFRDSNGLWENNKIEEICNEGTWKRNFEKVHNFYNQRRTQLKDTVPNEAHKTIKRIKDKYGDKCIVITQNIDNLLEKSGINNDEILHLHGYLEEMECYACGNKWKIGEIEFDIEKDKCPKCSSLKAVKPNVVFFNAPAPMYKYFHRALSYMYHPKSILIVIGTMGNVIRIDSLTSKFSKERKILNNLEKNEFINENNFGYQLFEKATTALPKIEEILENIFDK